MSTLIDSADRAALMSARRIALPGTLASFVFIVLALTSSEPGLQKLFDNLHWTSSYATAAALSWWGLRSASDRDRSARRWFAWGLTFSALGQLAWALQVAIGWNPFPAPSDVGYLLLGPLAALGFLAVLTAQQTRRMVGLDVAGLSVAVLVLTLALYLPRRHDVPLPQLLVLIAYPVVFAWPACLGLVVPIGLHLKPRLGAVLLSGSLFVQSALWLDWNVRLLEGTLQDGVLLNAAFSVSALTSGFGALLWSAEPSTSRRWVRFCEGFLRFLPLIIVVVAALAVLAAMLTPQVHPAVLAATVIGGLVVVVIASVRQMVLLTERERLLAAERELKTTRTKYEAALDVLPTPICIVTHPHGKLVELNRSFMERFALTAEEALGKSPSELGLWASLDDRDRFVRTMLAEKSVSGMSVTWRSRKGLEGHYVLTGSEISLDGVPHVVLVLLDIEERVKNEERYRTLVEAAADGIFITSTATRVVDANSRGLALLGRTREETLGKRLDEVIKPEDLPRLLASRDELQTKGRAVVELRFVRPDGSWFWGEVNASMLSDGQRLGIVRDVSERKAAEVVRLGLEARAREAQKLEAVGTMAAGIAHDFNNILLVIRGNVDLALQDLPADVATSSNLTAIRTASERATRLVRQILSFSRGRTVEASEVKLEPVVNEALTLLRSTLPRGIELEWSVDPSTPTVLADPTQVHQVLVNLCTNAWHAIEGIGGVRVRVERSTARDDRYPQLSTGDWAHLSVTDTGRGMSAETVARIFEPFFSTKAPGQGTGLGLWVVHNIVKEAKGVITVESTPGKGTRFDVYLPAFSSVAPPGEPPPSRRPEVVAKASQRIVYVDDEEAAVLVVKRLLERRGHRVTTFVSAASALAALEKDPGSFDVLATDFNMPKISGLELLAKVRALRPDARLLVTSGYVTDEMRLEAQRLGVEQIVYKASAEELCDAIDKVASPEVKAPA